MIPYDETNDNRKDVLGEISKYNASILRGFNPAVCYQLAKYIQHNREKIEELKCYDVPVEHIENRLLRIAYNEFCWYSQKKCWHSAVWLSHYFLLGCHPVSKDLEQSEEWTELANDWREVDSNCGGIHEDQDIPKM